ncbi:catalase [Phlyctema vagabunda]|uniref:Catalase n=1 Tax=Phlyctema vagabunda TaxID=108571 RepID=A0ABR4PNX6_9HELO
MRSSLAILGLAAVAAAQCPYMQTRDVDASEDLLEPYLVDDTDSFMSSNAGGPFSDQNSLTAGERGPSLLEDFIFRQKITSFDHERVPERAVHARGAGAHGTFESYGDYSNITAASFLGEAGKKTPVFVRFSTVAGSRGSADTARDIHGFATRFYTDEGNFDIVGNNVPVFFLQDAILFPDLVHAFKPKPDKEIPQAATAHDSAWDFFSQQPSSLHALFWAMAGNGLPRSYRHMDGFGVHTFRFVTDDGSSKLVKFHWKSVQGKASLIWEEAQVLAGKNADYHRADLWDAIEAGHGPEWELGVQIVEEEDVLAFGFDLLDPTKMIPEELVPVTLLGKMKLNRNPRNYFAETEQIMFQPGHIVRGVDFTDDPLLQGRIFSYLDTQINRHGGPNFEQLPINRPASPVHNNNRDGAGQNFIHLNTAAYSPNTLNSGSPKQANQTQGRGFFTAPRRTVTGSLNRAVSSTFADVWSQPRLFYNSLSAAEQQMLVNAIRFETSNLQSEIVKQNVLIQLNRVSHDLSVRVARVLGLTAPAADPTFYHDNSTAFVSVFGKALPSIATLKVGILATTSSPASLTQAQEVSAALALSNVTSVIVGESLATGFGQTYSAADASAFDGIIIAAGAETLFRANSSSTLYPTGRPSQILLDGYHWGKPVGALGSASNVLSGAGISTTAGVFSGNSTSDFVSQFEDGLKTFKFTDRFPVDSN